MKTDYFKLQEQMSRRFGAKPTEATIIAVIKTSTEPISLDEIAEQTKYSLATVSNAIRKFEMHGILFRSKKPGSKKVYVEAKKDFIKSMKENLKMVTSNIQLLVEALPLIIEKTKLRIQSKEGLGNQNDLQRDKKDLEMQKDELRQAKITSKIMAETLKKLEEH